jgi:hypothetical protein
MNRRPVAGGRSNYEQGFVAGKGQVTIFVPQQACNSTDSILSLAARADIMNVCWPTNDQAEQT